MTRAQGILRQTAEFSGAMFHPTIEHLFATSDVRGNVRLRDTRMAFGPLRQRTNDGVVLKVSPFGSLFLAASEHYRHPVRHEDDQAI